MTIRVMSSGRGYEYLLKSVVAGDGDRDMSTALTRYYTETGSPQGTWLGAGLAAFGAGAIRDSSGSYALAWYIAASLAVVASVASLSITKAAKPEPVLVA